MKTFIIQIRQTVTMSRTIKAETFDDAVIEAKTIDANAELSPICRTPKPWAHEWVDSAELVAVIG